jgi:hypothetical protein
MSELVPDPLLWVLLHLHRHLLRILLAILVDRLPLSTGHLLEIRLGTPLASLLPLQFDSDYDTRLLSPYPIYPLPTLPMSEAQWC